MLVWLELARANAPFLILAALLGGAALTVLTPNARTAWAMATLGALLSAVIAADLALRVLRSAAPLAFAQADLALRVDGIGAFAAPLITGAGALIVIAGGGLMRKDFSPRAAPFALALLLVMIAGWAGAALAEDFIGLFLAAEAAWLASVGLVALSGERDRAALTGALRMLSVGGVAAALMLLGVGLLHRGLGGLDLAAFAVAPVAAPDLASAGVGLVFAGLALKGGVAPLHLWLGAAFGRTGGLAALALGAVGITGALLAMARVAAAALTAPAIGQGAAMALLVLGLVSVAIGSVQAIGAVNIRRLAAYAGAAQAGCVLLSMALGSPAGFAAALVQIFALCVAALALFGGAAAMGGPGALNALDGLARRAPVASAAIAAGALSLMGAPLTLGSLGRWRMIEAGVGAGWWWTAGAVIVTSLAAVFYGGRLIERLYFRRASLPYEGASDPWRALLGPALVTAIAAITIGLAPGLLLQAAARAGGVP
jgi:formate hydrogenlyase subunit 3/multisubunit Na+/H+ antiporter MnhD subunit